MVKSSREASFHSQPLDNFPGGLLLAPIQLITHNCEIKINSLYQEFPITVQDSQQRSEKLLANGESQLFPKMHSALLPLAMESQWDTWPPRIKAIFPTSLQHGVAM